MGKVKDLLRKLSGLETANQPGDGLGRNDPCWCGSGKKYKHCHYEKDRARVGKPRSCGPSG